MVKQLDTVRIGNRIKAIRNMKDLSTYQMSSNCHMSPYEFNRIEHGRKQNPYEDLKEIASYLSIPLDYLIDDIPEITGLEDWSDYYILQEFERRFCTNI